LKFTSKKFKKENYFTLYDENDNIICYFDNFKELSKYTKVPMKMLVFKFNNSTGFINIKIEKTKYKLYTYKD